ncbi:hypothetical protein [Streptomyces uncialis]|uniref:hypothetical protein n=1 Tax=Streptomyces uncialis TaxID=1048205 RepID=UPI002253B5CD|nr:hypothetical protein [Streptomyces uncialis]MCX4661244.1 hypothetical protein [Streptomyces uncialis]
MLGALVLMRNGSSQEFRQFVDVAALQVAEVEAVEAQFGRLDALIAAASAWQHERTIMRDVHPHR